MDERSLDISNLHLAAEDSEMENSATGLVDGIDAFSDDDATLRSKC